ncbi:MAG: MMPL family transporter [Pseudomonadales bacterium]|nr:MMPL family transporter [Pseudomonadales bacterium]
MANALSRISIQYRWLFLILSLALVGFSTTGFKLFKFDASVRSYFSEDYSYYKDFSAMEDLFGRENIAMVMLSPRDGDVYSPRFLTALAQFTEQAWTLQGMQRVDSIANYQHTFVHDDELMVEDLIPADEVIDAKRADSIRNIVSNEVSLQNKLISADGKHVAVVFNYNVDEDDNEQIGVLALALYAYAEKFKASYNASGEDQIDTAVAGNLASIHNNIEIAKYDFGVMVPLMFLLMFAMLGVIMKTISGTATALVIAIMSAIGAYALGAYAGITFTMISFNGIIIIITITVAHCIHILQHFLQHYDGTNKPEALFDSLAINALPVSLTSLTTLLGFLSLNLSDLPPVVTLGNVSAIGVFLCWLFSFTVLPAMVLLLPFKAQGGNKTPRLDNFMLNMANFVIRNKGRILIATTVLSAVMFTLSMQNIINDRFSELIKEPHVFRTDNQNMDKHFGTMYNMNLSMDSGVANGISDPEYLANLDKLTIWLRTQPEVKSVAAISDIVKRLSQNLHAGDAAYYRIPESRELAAQYLLMYEMSLPFGLDLTNQIEMERRLSRVMITFSALDTIETFELAQRIIDWQKQNLPAAHQAEPTSVAVMWAHLSYDSLAASIESSLLALILISAIMMIALKSVKYGLISLVPNIFPAAFGFGIWYLIDGEINMGLTAVMIITIGIVVDDTVHFLSKYKYARETLGQNVEDAVRYAFTTVGSAIVITTMVLVTGFSLLLLSQSSSNSNLGLLTAAILFSAVVMDFLLLPVLLLFLDKDKPSSVAVEEKAAA